MDHAFARVGGAHYDKADADLANVRSAQFFPSISELAGGLTMKAIRFEKTGGPEVLQYVDYDLPAPGPGQIRIKHTAIGVNFIDTYHRSGLYPLPLPSGLGSEAAGVVEALGAGVTGFKIGERVGYCSGAIGAYAEANNVAAEKVVKLPDGVSDEVAAAAMLKGMTAQYLLRRIHPRQSGRDHRVPFRRRRRGPDRLPMGQASGRHRDRQHHLAGQSPSSPKKMAATMCSTPETRAGKNKCARSPRAWACRWSMIPSARTRSRLRSIVFRCAD